MQGSYIHRVVQKVQSMKQVTSKQQNATETEEESEVIEAENEQSFTVSPEHDDSQTINGAVDQNNVLLRSETNGSIPNDVTLGPNDGQVQSLKVELDSVDIGESSVEPKELSQKDCDNYDSLDFAEIRAIYSAIEKETHLHDPFQMSKELFQSARELALLCLQFEIYGEPNDILQSPLPKDFPGFSLAENDVDLSDDDIGAKIEKLAIDEQERNSIDQHEKRSDHPFWKFLKTYYFLYKEQIPDVITVIENGKFYTGLRWTVLLECMTGTCINKNYWYSQINHDQEYNNVQLKAD